MGVGVWGEGRNQAFALEVELLLGLRCPSDVPEEVRGGQCGVLKAGIQRVPGVHGNDWH